MFKKLVTAAVAPVASASVVAADYAEKTITMVIPFSAGAALVPIFYPVRRY